MGERGPLPVPPARRRNRRRRTGKAATVARPSLPRNLSPEARAEWRRVVPELEAMGVLATVDRALLIRYCTAWADWVKLQELLWITRRSVTEGSQPSTIRRALPRSEQDATRKRMEDELTDAECLEAVNTLPARSEAQKGSCGPAW